MFYNSLVVVAKDGTIEYRGDYDDFHRLDGPARIKPNGSEIYYVDNEIHRYGDNPAVVNSNGYRAYYEFDQRHRINGPAVILGDGTKEYYLNDKKLTEDEFVLKQSGSKRYEDEYGNVSWRNEEGLFHRLDAPVFISSNGVEEFYQNGVKQEGPKKYEEYAENMREI